MLRATEDKQKQKPKVESDSDGKTSDPHGPPRVTIALIGFASAVITAFLTNADRLVSLAVATPIESHQHVEGQQSVQIWRCTGVFKEFDYEGKTETTSSEAVRLEVGKNGEFRGFWATTDQMTRNANLTGRVEAGLLILSYFNDDPPRRSGGAYVLKETVDGGTWQGYYLAFDPEMKEIVMAPYVLSRTAGTDELKKKFALWLSQPIRPTKQTPRTPQEDVGMKAPMLMKPNKLCMKAPMLMKPNKLCMKAPCEIQAAMIS